MVVCMKMGRVFVPLVFEESLAGSAEAL